jgi:hypothetical protein
MWNFYTTQNISLVVLLIVFVSILVEEAAAQVQRQLDFHHPQHDAAFFFWGAALFEAFRLPLLGVSRDFCKVAASHCRFLNARAAASSSARAFFSFSRFSFACCRATFAASACIFFYNVTAAFSSLS